MKSTHLFFLVLLGLILLLHYTYIYLYLTFLGRLAVSSIIRPVALV